MKRAEKAGHHDIVKTFKSNGVTSDVSILIISIVIDMLCQ